MADPRQLHLNGIGSADDVLTDWIEQLENDYVPGSPDLDAVKGFGELLKSEQFRVPLLALACAHFNSNLDQHGRLLRVSDTGELTISDRLIGPDLQMMKDFLSAI